MRVIASEEAIAVIREGGGHVFVWTIPMDIPSGGATVFALEASTASPGAEREFRRFEGDDFDVLFQLDDREPPDELHLLVKGWARKRIRAYWNGNSFGRD